MSEEMVRIEGLTTQFNKDWIEFEALRTQTPIRIIVGNAISLYKATNEQSIIGQNAQFEYICEQKMKKILQNSCKISQKNGLFDSKSANFSHSIAQKLLLWGKKTNKKERFHHRSLRRGLIVDFIDAVSHIEHSNKPLYQHCCEIVRKSVYKDDLMFYDELSKRPGTSGPPIVYNGKIEYTGGTLDCDIPEMAIMDMINNCKTIPKGNLREKKIHDTIYYIQTHFDSDKVSGLCAMFENGINRMEIEES